MRRGRCENLHGGDGAVEPKRRQSLGPAAKLKQQLADAEKRLVTLTTRNDQLERESADYAQRTYLWRTTYQTWQSFLGLRPEIRRNWDRFLQTDWAIGEMAPTVLNNPNWPLIDR